MENYKKITAKQRHETVNGITFPVDEWEYDLPENWRKFDTPPKEGKGIPIETPDGETLGWACPVLYVIHGKVFKTFRQLQLYDGFHPSEFYECRREDLDDTISRSEKIFYE